LAAHDPAQTDDAPLAFQLHDHRRCRTRLRAEAEALIAERGLRLTPMRARVLEILLEEHRALRAYEVLDRLTEEGAARQPPIAYRALEFLTTHGLAHRLEGLNAFIACACPGRRHDAVFLICGPCGTVAELAEPNATDPLRARAAAAGFTATAATVEIDGVCPACHTAERS